MAIKTTITGRNFHPLIHVNIHGTQYILRLNDDNQGLG